MTLDVTLHAANDDGGGAIDRLFDALAAGDVAAAVAACTPDAVVWHSFDRIAMTLDAAASGWKDLVANFPERRFVDVRRAPIPGGFVQRHQMIGKTATGVQLAWPICIFVSIREGRVARLDEYIDRGGNYVVTDRGEATPGLPPRRDGRSDLV